MAQTHTEARKRKDCFALHCDGRLAGVEDRFPQPTAEAENRPNLHRSKKAQALHCLALRLPLGRCGRKVLAANGWKDELLELTQEQSSARTALPCIAATAWLVRDKGFRSQLLPAAENVLTLH